MYAKSLLLMFEDGRARYVLLVTVACIFVNEIIWNPSLQYSPRLAIIDPL